MLNLYGAPIPSAKDRLITEISQSEKQQIAKIYCEEIKTERNIYFKIVH